MNRRSLTPVGLSRSRSAEVSRPWCLLMAGIALLLSPSVNAEPPQDPTKLDPVDAYLTREAAERHYSAGEYEKALELFRKLQRADPEEGRHLLRVGHALGRLGRREEAAPYIEKALARGYGFRPRLALGLADFNAQNDRTDVALRWISIALESRQENRSALADRPGLAALADDPAFVRMAGIIPPDVGSDRVAGWTHDLDYFLEEARRLHAGPDRPAHRPEFERSVRDLQGRIGELTDEEIVAELQGIVASRPRTTSPTATPRSRRSRG